MAAIGELSSVNVTLLLKIVTEPAYPSVGAAQQVVTSISFPQAFYSLDGVDRLFNS